MLLKCNTTKNGTYHILKITHLCVGPPCRTEVIKFHKLYVETCYRILFRMYCELILKKNVISVILFQTGTFITIIYVSYKRSCSNPEIKNINKYTKLDKLIVINFGGIFFSFFDVSLSATDRQKS